MIATCYVMYRSTGTLSQIHTITKAVPTIYASVGNTSFGVINVDGINNYLYRATQETYFWRRYLTNNAWAFATNDGYTLLAYMHMQMRLLRHVGGRQK